VISRRERRLARRRRSWSLEHAVTGSLESLGQDRAEGTGALGRDQDTATPPGVFRSIQAARDTRTACRKRRLGGQSSDGHSMTA
jgi:hypothetical protein